MSLPVRNKLLPDLTIICAVGQIPVKQIIIKLQVNLWLIRALTNIIMYFMYVAFREFSVNMTNFKLSIGFIPKLTLKCPLSGPSGILYQLEL